MNMGDFAAPRQFERAGKILRKLMYKNTMSQEDRPEDIPYFNYSSAGTEPVIGVEGHQMVYIEIPQFRMYPDDVDSIRSIDEIKDRDTMSFSEDGFKLYINTEEMAEE